MDIKEETVFPRGDKIKNKYFTGTVYLNILVPRESALNCPCGSVTFEPGARNNWHSHPGGQLLLITGGKGFYQEWGKPALRLKAGDVVEIPADVKHWHGASNDSRFAHIYVEANPQKGQCLWMESVDDNQYAEANREV